MPLRYDCAICFVRDAVFGLALGSGSGGPAAAVRSGSPDSPLASARRDRTGGRGAGVALLQPVEGLLVRLTLSQEAFIAAIAHDGLPFALDAIEIGAAARTALSGCDARKDHERQCDQECLRHDVLRVARVKAGDRERHDSSSCANAKYPSLGGFLMCAFARCAGPRAFLVIGNSRGLSPEARLGRRLNLTGVESCQIATVRRIDSAAD